MAEKWYVNRNGNMVCLEYADEIIYIGFDELEAIPNFDGHQAAFGDVSMNSSLRDVQMRGSVFKLDEFRHVAPCGKIVPGELVPAPTLKFFIWIYPIESTPSFWDVVIHFSPSCQLL